MRVSFEPQDTQQSQSLDNIGHGRRRIRVGCDYFSSQTNFDPVWQDTKQIHQGQEGHAILEPPVWTAVFWIFLRSVDPQCIFNGEDGHGKELKRVQHNMDMRGQIRQGIQHEGERSQDNQHIDKYIKALRLRRCMGMNEVVPRSARGVVRCLETRRQGSVFDNWCRVILIFASFGNDIFQSISNDTGRQGKDGYRNNGRQRADPLTGRRMIINERKFSKQVQQGIVTSHGNAVV
mmetsp:Transcript_3259/g.6727  ORF Transcript_3259/g.6727 Transcript_3259/m.6727 type:complete len:234 (-) Transcript_3259:1082-1783(-)